MGHNQVTFDDLCARIVVVPFVADLDGRLAGLIEQYVQQNGGGDQCLGLVDMVANACQRLADRLIAQLLGSPDDPDALLIVFEETSSGMQHIYELEHAADQGWRNQQAERVLSVLVSRMSVLCSRVIYTASSHRTDGVGSVSTLADWALAFRRAAAFEHVLKPVFGRGFRLCRRLTDRKCSKIEDGLQLADNQRVWASLSLVGRLLGSGVQRHLSDHGDWFDRHFPDVRPVHVRFSECVDSCRQWLDERTLAPCRAIGRVAVVPEQLVCLMRTTQAIEELLVLDWSATSGSGVSIHELLAAAERCLGAVVAKRSQCYVDFCAHLQQVLEQLQSGDEQETAVSWLTHWLRRASNDVALADYYAELRRQLLSTAQTAAWRAFDSSNLAVKRRQINVLQSLCLHAGTPAAVESVYAAVLHNYQSDSRAHVELFRSHLASGNGHLAHHYIESLGNAAHLAERLTAEAGATVQQLLQQLRAALSHTMRLDSETLLIANRLLSFRDFRSEVGSVDECFRHAATLLHDRLDSMRGDAVDAANVRDYRRADQLCDVVASALAALAPVIDETYKGLALDIRQQIDRAVDREFQLIRDGPVQQLLVVATSTNARLSASHMHQWSSAFVERYQRERDVDTRALLKAAAPPHLCDALADFPQRLPAVSASDSQLMRVFDPCAQTWRTTLRLICALATMFLFGLAVGELRCAALYRLEI